MIHGKDSFFEREHIEAHRGRAPAELAELVVYCLELVSQLSAKGFEYRFKGGNSLLVMLEDPQRFSIDVDIGTTESKEKLISVMEDIAESCERFTKLEVRPHKTKPWLPMISFNLYFNSHFTTPDNAFIMLDAVLKPVPYDGHKKQVRCGSLYESDHQVEVATIEGLIGDKLLTLGPNTQGIPVGKGKAAQRLKHVFDVSLLASGTVDTAKVKESITNCIESENEIQKSNYTIEEIIDDTVLFCTLTKDYSEIPDSETIEEGTALYEIVTGFDEFRDYLFKSDYSWQDLNNNFAEICTLVSSLK